MNGDTPGNNGPMMVGSGGDLVVRAGDGGGQA
jgi:hypothetical protein